MATTSRSNTQKGKGVTRIPVAFDNPSASNEVDDDVVMLRQERQQNSTGRIHCSDRTAVVDTPSLPVENSEIGLDLDSAQADDEWDKDFVDVEENTKAIKEEKKKSKKSLTS
ncbi:hypothetical protein GALMADRAFT_216635 [Galerina marginata CBS 339.88]|uniref:Uncharacterized protein n=1 Tax=Galerina marginata (strain CBS 339.88) TaxID=685588 RepID=A0A067SB03_GALM3|nr:hypothetical protein GALMADRAFT_216635 [Galerina marginata CBS 339.88]